jgi:hypothetical protein
MEGHGDKGSDRSDFDPLESFDDRKFDAREDADASNAGNARSASTSSNASNTSNTGHTANTGGNAGASPARLGQHRFC